MTSLGKYLFKRSYQNKELSRKTGITAGRISNLRNKEDVKLLGKELYLIALATGEKPAHLAGILFKDLTLNSSVTELEPPEERQKELTKLGLYLEEKSRSQKAIERKTSITENRLSILANDLDSKILAKEVYLISLAMEVDQDEIWDYLFGDLTLKGPESEGNLASDNNKE